MTDTTKDLRDAMLILEQARALRDTFPFGDIRQAMNAACDRLEVAASHIAATQPPATPVICSGDLATSSGDFGQPAPSAPEQPDGYVTSLEEGKVLMLPRASLDTDRLIPVFAGRRQPAQPSAGVEAVGEAQLAGAIGFTCAYFKRTDVPEGTKLYTAPPSVPVALTLDRGAE